MNLKGSEYDQLSAIVEKFPRTTVTVLGDMVADEFVFGEISRVSREAPVLILKHRERTVVPGGGANAVYNLATLGVRVLPVGWVGADEPGRLLLERFREKRISTQGILRLKDERTVTKTRILAGMTHTSRQQVVRIDREPAAELALRHSRQLASLALQQLRRSNGLLISDYGYGSATPELFARIFKTGRTTGVPVTLDSRYRMLSYSGVTSATPNEPEVEEALRFPIENDPSRLAQAGRRLLRRMQLESLVITRGRHGMVVFTRGAEPVEIPVFGSDQVADVTGAGDTVIAAFTAALAAGAGPASAARIANYAGGIVVMKRGTATVSRDELLAAMKSDASKGAR
ncbi:MAG TPA: PfkB family carbohydrate kinase [Terriglobales bacterium]|nr:PfkB family carbohydrate kinase [Terriglobales bacterium]